MGKTIKIVTCGDCDRRRAHYSRGLCKPCYNRRWLAGTLWPVIPWTAPTEAPTEPPRFGSERLPARFWDKVTVSQAGCWVWSGTTTRGGYGMVHTTERQRASHALAYEVLVGAVPDGLELDHLCHTLDPTCVDGPSCPHRICCNPNHLEPVTHKVNMERGIIASRTHCKRGHLLAGENLQRSRTGVRRCQVCIRIGARRRKGLARAARESASRVERAG